MTQTRWQKAAADTVRFESSRALYQLIAQVAWGYSVDGRVYPQARLAAMNIADFAASDPMPRSFIAAQAARPQ